MGKVFSNFIGTCNCSSDDNKEDETNLSNLKEECNDIKHRLDRLEDASQSKYNLTNQKIENIEIKIGNKLNIMNEKFSRLEDKIDTKFDLIILTMNQNSIRNNINNN